MLSPQFNIFHPSPKPRKPKRALVTSSLVAGVAVLIIVVVVLATRPNNDTSSVTATGAQGQATPAPSVSMSPSISLKPSWIPSASPVPTNTPSAQPTKGPTMQPSVTPSLSPSISEKPSMEPSISPTQEPTDSPTTTPSYEPTVSVAPSDLPSVLPSLEPSEQPTDSPSGKPSLSFAPSFAPFDPDFAFRIKLHWQKGYYWQESTSEKKYCMECCECPKINFDQFPKGCKKASCNHQRQLWIWDCGGGRGENFVVVHVGDFIQIKLEEHNLCFTRYKKGVITIEDCDATNRDQLWKPISAHVEFSIEPAFQGEDDDEPYCVTQHHHPKNGEMVGLQRCGTAFRHETMHWNAYRSD